MNKLTRPEIRLAAEAIAVTAWERGASPDGIEYAVDKAFRRDGERARALAKAYAASALDRWEAAQ